jgi:hypothetical protein
MPIQEKQKKDKKEMPPLWPSEPTNMCIVCSFCTGKAEMQNARERKGKERLISSSAKGKQATSKQEYTCRLQKKWFMCPGTFSLHFSQSGR